VITINENGFFKDEFGEVEDGALSEPLKFVYRKSTKDLFVVIKIDESLTYDPWKEVSCAGVVIKAQDLLSPSGYRTNKYFDRIKKAGGLHEYFGCDVDMILSSIMPDKMLYGFSVQAYADMINTLQPDYYYTPDGETYLGEEWLSQMEINRVCADTRYLIRTFPNIKPIGLVKGCNIHQIDNHTNYLRRSGISRLVFHTGDYICRGSSAAIEQAIFFASSIRKKAPYLLVNGLGSMSSLKNFNFSDGIVTQNHFVEAFNGHFCNTDRSSGERRAVSRNDIMNNLRNIERNVSAIRLQKSLADWILSDGELSDGHHVLSDGSMNSRGGS